MNKVGGVLQYGVIEALGQVGTSPDGGCTRLALTDADKEGRDCVVSVMQELGLEVRVDQVGNVVGVRAGQTKRGPILMGSHIDSVRRGGKFDGVLGVASALEVIKYLNDNNVRTNHPFAVGLFTNEEGAYYSPDMTGSAVYTGALGLETALDLRSVDGHMLGEELRRIGYAGPVQCPGERPAAYLELHVEQGGKLDKAGKTIGVVTGIQGISWPTVKVVGHANHGGTTATEDRRNAGAAVCRIAAYASFLPVQMRDNLLLVNPGRIVFEPNLRNVIPGRALLELDLRHPNWGVLEEVEDMIIQFVKGVALELRVTIENIIELENRQWPARFRPVPFENRVVEMVEEVAHGFEFSTMRLHSGAGHDAQMFAKICPTGMIFVPSVKGLSHCPEEFTSEEHCVAGANVLLNTALVLDWRL